MTEREHAHKLIDCLPETQLSALVVLLETIVEPEEVALGDAPFDDEPETDAERLAVAQARASLEKNGGKGVPHNETTAVSNLGEPTKRPKGEPHSR
jgi:hypothetical protein